MQLPQKLFGFDEAHPGIADQHYARSKEQNVALEKERQTITERARKWVL